MLLNTHIHLIAGVWTTDLILFTTLVFNMFWTTFLKCTICNLTKSCDYWCLQKSALHPYKFSHLFDKIYSKKFFCPSNFGIGFFINTQPCLFYYCQRIVFELKWIQYLKFWFFKALSNLALFFQNTMVLENFLSFVAFSSFSTFAKALSPQSWHQAHQSSHCLTLSFSLWTSYKCQTDSSDKRMIDQKFIINLDLFYFGASGKISNLTNSCIYLSLQNLYKFKISQVVNKITCKKFLCFKRKIYIPQEICETSFSPPVIKSSYRSHKLLNTYPQKGWQDMLQEMSVSRAFR